MINLLKQLRIEFELKRLQKEQPETEEPLCVMNDRVFKLMLASETEDSREALKSLLSACTRREVLNVEVLNNELLPVHLEGKSPRLDIRVMFNDGDIANLEMQISLSSDNIKNRSSLYMSMLQAAQGKKGKKYGEIKSVYQIFFINDVLFPNSSKIPRRYGLREEKEHDLLTDTTEVIYYELPKLERKAEEYFAGRLKLESLSNEEKWCIFFKYHHEKQAKRLISELCEKEEGIMRAEKEAKKIKRNLSRYFEEMGYIKNEWDIHDRIASARRESMAEGKASNQISIAKNLIKKGFPIEEIAEITELPIEDINKLI